MCPLVKPLHSYTVKWYYCEIEESRTNSSAMMLQIIHSHGLGLLNAKSHNTEKNNLHCAASLTTEFQSASGNIISRNVHMKLH